MLLPLLFSRLWFDGKEKNGTIAEIDFVCSIIKGVGVGLSGLKQSWPVLFNLAQRRMLVTLEISSKDRSYLWFLNWMSKQSQKNSSTHQLAAETSYPSYLMVLMRSILHSYLALGLVS
ncbi:hypothetical protein PSTT_15002, partial [Puccinia striiformis]